MGIKNDENRKLINNRNGHLEADRHRCGFCGTVGCNITLVNAGSIGKGMIYPSSHCKYYNKFNNKSKSTFIKCTNKSASIM